MNWPRIHEELGSQTLEFYEVTELFSQRKEDFSSSEVSTLVERILKKICCRKVERIVL